MCCMGGWAHATSCLSRVVCSILTKPWHTGLFARLAAGMRWSAQTADALAWLPGWLTREPGLLARLAAEAPALLPALAARFLPKAGDHGLAPGAYPNRGGREGLCSSICEGFPFGHAHCCACGKRLPAQAGRLL